MALGQPGFATSYVDTQDSEDDDAQSSVAIGSYLGKEQDLVILDWWHGEVSTDTNGRHLYRFPAFESVDGSPVPEAHLFAWVDGQLLILVRVVDMTPEGEREILQSVVQADSGSWRSAVASILTSNGSDDVQVIARSRDEERWALTVTQQPGGPVICLDVQNGGTGCTAGETLGPADGQHVGVMGTVDTVDGAYVFGIVAPDISAAIASTSSGDALHVELVPIQGLGQAFVLVAPSDAAAINVVTEAPSGTQQVQISIDSK